MNPDNLTENDKKLISEAEKLHYIDWGLIDLDKTDTEEGRKKLGSIRSRLYHKEEYSSNLL